MYVPSGTTDVLARPNRPYSDFPRRVTTSRIRANVSTRADFRWPKRVASCRKVQRVFNRKHEKPFRRKVRGKKRFVYVIAQHVLLTFVAHELATFSSTNISVRYIHSAGDAVYSVVRSWLVRFFVRAFVKTANRCKHRNV